MNKKLFDLFFIKYTHKVYIFESLFIVKTFKIFKNVELNKHTLIFYSTTNKCKPLFQSPMDEKILVFSMEKREYFCQIEEFYTIYHFIFKKSIQLENKKIQLKFMLKLNFKL